MSRSNYGRRHDDIHLTADGMKMLFSHIDDMDRKHGENYARLESRTAALGAEMSEIKTAVARQTSTIDSMSTSVSALVDRANRPHNLLGLGSLLVSILIVAAGFITLRLQPIEAQVAEVDADVDQMRVRVLSAESMGRRNMEWTRWAERILWEEFDAGVD